MFLLTRLRRARLLRQPLPPEWRAFVERSFTFYPLLPTQDQEELLGHMKIFLAEKEFEGAGGMEVSDTMRLTVAAHACLLLLHRRTGYYPHVSSVIIYPAEFVAPVTDVDEAGVVTEWKDIRSGESWGGGTLVISWEDVQLGNTEAYRDYNVIIHEFAHQLDDEDGITPYSGEMRPRHPMWERTLRAEYERLRREAELGRETLLDPYGTENPAEFFAVATECFFHLPRELKACHPELYRELAGYFRQDPSEWRWDNLERVSRPAVQHR